MEQEDNRVIKVLKWAGIVALVALPVIYLLKKKKPEDSTLSLDDESNIFNAELED